MSQQTTDNFWQTWHTFDWPEPKPITYRLYHDAQGRPVMYTMEDLPGSYIEVDKETYVQAPSNVLIQDGKLTVLEPKVLVSTMRPNATTGTPCHVRAVTVVVNAEQPHRKWSMQSHESD